MYRDTEATAPMALTRSDCLSLLATCSVGRLIFTRNALPAARPVIYLLDDEEVIFRTPPDGPLASAADNTIVAFQVDEIHPATHTGWSVCGVGQAYRIVDPRRLDELAALFPAHWAPVESVVASIPLQRLNGQQLVLTDGIS